MTFLTLYLTLIALVSALLVLDRPAPDAEIDPAELGLEDPPDSPDRLERLTRAFESMSRSLEESETRLSAIVDTAVDAILTIDEAGIVLSVNRATEPMFGHAADELVGRNVSILMDSPDREAHDDYIQAYLQTGIPKIIGIGRQVRGRRKDGSTFPVDLAVSEVKFGATRLFTGVLRDISDRVPDQSDR